MSDFPPPDSYNPPLQIGGPNTVRMAWGRFVRSGGDFGRRLQGESAMLMIDEAFPHFVLAQFDNLEHPYWSHGWHPLSASDFGGIRFAHSESSEESVCEFCGLSAEEITEGDLECAPRLGRGP